MILSYSFSMPGPSHIRNNRVCQDSNYVLQNDNICVASIADGIGSEKHSDVASECASRVSVEYCYSNYSSDLSDVEIIELLKNSFYKALFAVEQCANENNYEISQCHTTLSLVLYDGHRIFYGHCGDGGVIALSSKGEYLKLTKPQNDEQGRVYHLGHENMWVFDKTECDVASIILATDGMYNDAFHPILLGNNYLHRSDLYYHLLGYFMDNNYLNANPQNIKRIQAERENYTKNISDKVVDDDKTIVVIVNNSIKTRSIEYEKPNWVELNRLYDDRINSIPYETVDHIDNTFYNSNGEEIQLIRTLYQNIPRYMTSNKKIVEFSPSDAGDKNKFLKRRVDDIYSHAILFFPEDCIYNSGEFVGWIMPKYCDYSHVFGLALKSHTLSSENRIKLASNLCDLIQSVYDIDWNIINLDLMHIRYNDNYDVMIDNVSRDRDCKVMRFSKPEQPICSSLSSANFDMQFFIKYIQKRLMDL